MGWWFAYTGAVSIFSIMTLFNPVVQSTWADLGISTFAGVTVTLLSGAMYLAAGVGILRGKRWGRTLYLSYGPVGLVINVAVFRSSLTMVLVGLVVYAVIAFFLMREPAKAYFNGTYELDPDDQRRRRVIASIRAEQRNQSDLKRVFGVIFAAGAAFLIYMSLLVFGFAEGMIAVILAAFFGIPALIAFGIGILLWGRTRWAGFSGWALAVNGAMSAITGLSMFVMQRTEIWEAAMAQSEQAVDIDARLFIRLGLLGMLIGLIGVALLHHQHHEDQAKADLILEGSVSSDTF